MMTRPNVMLKSLLLTTVSHGVLDFVCAPKMFALRIAANYGARVSEGHLALSSSLKTPLSFLAWVQMWLRLVLGLKGRENPSAIAVGTYAVSVISYRQVDPSRLTKHTAHNLEALMRFVLDDLGQGLTLNQYRERFTRLSVMGRVQIYRALARIYLSWRGCILALCATLGAMNSVGSILFQAPLRPD